MSVSIDVRYTGDLRTEAHHGPSGSTLKTDAPVDNHGKGEMFAPTDLVATALASCVLTIMGQVAERHGIDLVGASARVEKHMTSKPTRRIGKLELVVHVPADLDPTQRKIMERAAHACPVEKSLSEAIEVAVTFVWGDG